METRIEISESEAKKVYGELKKKDYSLREINSEIGTDFRNCLYKRHSLSKKSFKKLQSLYSGEISHSIKLHTDGKQSPDKVENLTKSIELAEFMGIMLGDGHLRTNGQNYLCVTLHEDETLLIEKTEKLCSSLTGKEPRKYELKGSRAIQLKVHSKEIVEELENLGLKSGDKVENQVGVPKWIKEEKSYSKACLRGLVDTDGTIYQQNRDSRTIIRFKNHSLALLDNFRQLCKELNIKTTKGGGKYSVQIAKQEEVNKFLEKIEPIKRNNI